MLELTSLRALLRAMAVLGASAMLIANIVFASQRTWADEVGSSDAISWEERLEMLRAVPYVGFSESEAQEGKLGVVYHDREKASDGYNLYRALSLGETHLFDMDGQVVHSWTYPIKPNRRDTGFSLMLGNGDLIVIRDFLEMFRIDWNSKLLWRRSMAVHHDAVPAPDGSLYALIRLERQHRGHRVIFTGIAHLTADGKEIDRWSSYEHLDEIGGILDRRSFLDTILDSLQQGRRPQRGVENRPKISHRPAAGTYDYFHANTISLIPATPAGERESPFKPGNLLVCFRNVNQIAVLEKNTYRVLWAWGEGVLQGPHHPTMLENGHILIFDNGIHRNYSRVLEMDPLEESIVWEYVAEVPGDFYSVSRGSAQRLPNGNTLICESERGHVFEVTGGGELVWEWLNPVTGGPEWKSLDQDESHRTDRHCETVYKMMRLPASQVEPLLSRWWWWE